MRILIAGNWKMNGSRHQLDAWVDAMMAAGSVGVDLLVCPPFTLIERAARLLAGSGVAVGGQDCHAAAEGAFTGDVSAVMLRDVGATHVIVGHSERRAGYAESDAAVRRKAEAALAAGLAPIVCVGETADQRRAGTQKQVIGAQLDGSLPPGFSGIVAYEPVWAIGTGLVPSLADVAAMHAFILGRCGATQVLYGGSVKPDNATSLLTVPGVGGALVGGASLDAAGFLKIAGAIARPGPLKLLD